MQSSPLREICESVRGARSFRKLARPSSMRPRGECAEPLFAGRVNRTIQRPLFCRWQALAFVCVLVVLLGSLLFGGREAQAQKPDKASNNQRSDHAESKQRPSDQQSNARPENHRPDAEHPRNGGGRPADPPAGPGQQEPPGQQHQPPGQQHQPPGQQHGGGRPAEPPAGPGQQEPPGQQHQPPEPPGQQPGGGGQVEPPATGSPAVEPPTDPVGPGQQHEGNGPYTEQLPPAAEPPQPGYSEEQPSPNEPYQQPSVQQPAPWSVDQQPVSQLAAFVEPVGQTIAEPVEVTEPVGGATAEPYVQVGFEESVDPAREPSAARVLQGLSIKPAMLSLESLVRDTADSVVKLAGEAAGSVLDLLAGLFQGGGAPSDTFPFPTGAGPPVGNTLSGFNSSGSGVGPLLAVLALFVFAFLHKARFWNFYELPKPGLVPRLTPERPG